MTEHRKASERIHRARRGTTAYWESLERRTSTAFIAGGALLLVSTILFASDAVTSLAIQGTIPGIISLTGLVVSYLGVLGLYPRLVKGTPRLASIGLVLVGLPVIVLSMLVIWGAAGHALSVAPVPPAVIPAFGLLFVAMFLVLGVGMAVFGVGGLWSNSVSRSVACLLLVLALTWFLLLVVSAMAGSMLPVWLDAVTLGMMAAAMLTLGYRVDAYSSGSPR